MADERPLASILIPTRDRRELLARLLRSLARQTVSPASYEVIVSLDGADSETPQFLRAQQLPYALQIVQGPRAGRATACNRALARAAGEVIVVLDDDMEVVPAFLERHLAHHGDGAPVCVMGAVPVRIAPGSPHAARYVERKFGEHMRNLSRPGHVFGPRDFYSGNASLRADVLRKVGTFDEAFAAYGNEDVELSVRLASAGVQFRFDDTATAQQEYAKDLSALAADTRAKGSTAVLLARKHPAVFDQLRLARPYDGSRPWLAARAVLLRLARRRPKSAVVPLHAGALLERLGLWRSPLFYRALLDYAFWVGAQEALHRSDPAPPLDRLRRQLNRGPLDLLLHR